MDANQIGKLLANGTSPSTVSRACGIALSVLHESKDVQEAIVRETLRRTEQDITTKDGISDLKEAVIYKLKDEVATATPSELTALLRELSRMDVSVTTERKGSQDIGKVSITVNQLSAPKMQISNRGEIVSIEGNSILPAMGDRLNEIIEGTEGSPDAAVEAVL